MFISNKEKSQISEKFEQQKIQIEKLVKHVAKLQVDTQGADLTQIPALVESNKQITKSYWAHMGKLKTLEKTIASLSSTNDMLRQNNEALIKRIGNLEGTKKPMGRPPKKLVISPDKVQALKDAGIWDDPQKRIEVIDQIIRQEEAKKIEEKKIRQRGYNQAYRLKMKLKKITVKQEEK